MRELSLFTGIGGGLLGSMLLGWRTVAAVERDPYCQRVLCARGGYMADAERSDSDGRAVESEREAQGRTTPDGYGAFPVFSDIRTFHPAIPCDIVTGGFPCQPHSQAGKRLGGLDDRDLWPDTVRVLRESSAPLGFFENVPGLLTSRDADGLPMFGRILGDLSEAGFDAEWIVLGADDVGAPHRRKRLWILAYRPRFRGGQPRVGTLDGCQDGRRADPEHEIGGAVADRDRGRCEQRDAGVGPVPEPDEDRTGLSPWWRDPADVGDAALDRVEGLRPAGEQEPAIQAGAALSGRGGLRGRSAQDLRDAAERGQPVRGPSPQPGDERHALCPDRDGHVLDPWLAEPYVGRVAHGVPSRVDRLRGLGNAQVPQCMAAAFTILAARAGLTA